jgi:hypothetical protein
MILRNISCRLTIKLYYILYFERTQHHVSNNERPNTLAATIVCCPSFVFLIYKLLPLIALVLTCCHSIRCYSTSAVTCSLLSNASSIPNTKAEFAHPIRITQTIILHIVPCGYHYPFGYHCRLITVFISFV